MAWFLTLTRRGFANTWYLSYGLRGRNQPCELERLMRKGFVEEAGLGGGGGVERKGQDSGSVALAEYQEREGGLSGLWAAPGGHRLGPRGRNWQRPSVRSARPSRSGTSWPTRLPTAAAKGEPWHGVSGWGLGVSRLWDRPLLTPPCPRPEPWPWRRSGAWRRASPSWRRSWRRSRATRSW